MRFKKTVLTLCALVALLQWLVVFSFISRAYLWFFKANSFQVDAGIGGTLVMAVFVCAAMIYAAYFYTTTKLNDVWLRVSSILILLVGLSGQLVFWGLATTGILILANR